MGEDNEQCQFRKEQIFQDVKHCGIKKIEL